MSEGLTRYYLGCDPEWLYRPPADMPANVGLFVQHGRLSRRDRALSFKPYRLAAPGVSWALDSGGFNQLSRFGKYTFSADEYVRAMRRYDAEIGGLEWVAPMDWMCEPDQVDKTGLSVREHIERTVANFVELCDLWWHLEDVYTGKQLRIPGYRSDRASEFCPIKPVLQGWTLADYLWCVDLYEQAGVRLAEHLVVGLGSICRRANTTEGVELLRGLHREFSQRYPGSVDEYGGTYPSGLSIHAFGVKTTALARVPHIVESADSRAASFGARMRVGHCQHPGSGVVWEQNCPIHAREWLGKVLRSADRDAELVVEHPRLPGQRSLFALAD